MTDRWTDRLSEYLDGTLSPSERREAEEHLTDCTTCAAVLEDLRDIVARARGLRELDASIGVGSDLWPGIEARIRELPATAAQAVAATPQRGCGAQRFSLSFPQAAVAAVALVAVSAASLWFADDFLGRQQAAERAARGTRVTAVPASNASLEAALAEIEQLRELLSMRRDDLDPETLRALEGSLGSIEAAVGDARGALEADPGNPYIQSHLEAMKERQLHLLRRAVALAGGAE